MWGLSSPTRDRTRIFHIGSTECQPLDGQGSPRSVFVVALVIKSSFYFKTYADIHIWFLLVLLWLFFFFFTLKFWFQGSWYCSWISWLLNQALPSRDQGTDPVSPRIWGGGSSSPVPTSLIFWSLSPAPLYLGLISDRIFNLDSYSGWHSACFDMAIVSYSHWLSSLKFMFPPLLSCINIP